MLTDHPNGHPAVSQRYEVRTEVAEIPTAFPREVADGIVCRVEAYLLKFTVDSLSDVSCCATGIEDRHVGRPVTDKGLNQLVEPSDS